MNATSRIAVVLSVTAAFLWASYYFIALAIAPQISLAELIVLPFLIGGVAYAAISARQGSLPAYAQLLREPRSWGRASLYAGIQLTVVAVTLYSGPVDTALLTLVGDVLLTPLVAATLYGHGRRQVMAVAFWVGVVFVSAGAALTIISAGAAEPLRGYALVDGILLPAFIALYFVMSAEAARTQPADAIVGATCIQAGVLVLILTPFVGGALGGWSHRGR